MKIKNKIINKKYNPRNNFITPPNIFAQLDCTFDLDPCASRLQEFQTAEHLIYPPKDGLDEPWFGFVWCHPPHESNISKWMKKNIEHKNSIAFYIANTHARNFQKLVLTKADALFYLRDRQRMCKDNGDPNNEKGATGYCEPMVLAAYGSKAVNILKNTKIKGSFLEIIPTAIKKTNSIPQTKTKTQTFSL